MSNSSQAQSPTPEELDAQIAAWMGLVEGRDFGDWLEHSRIGQPPGASFCTRCGERTEGIHLDHAFPRCHKPPPAYSTDRALLGDVLARLAERYHVAIETTIRHNPKEQWLVRVLHFATLELIAEAWADTPQRALALAVIAAMKEQDNANA